MLFVACATCNLTQAQKFYPTSTTLHISSCSSCAVQRNTGLCHFRAKIVYPVFRHATYAATATHLNIVSNTHIKYAFSNRSPQLSQKHIVTKQVLALISLIA